MKRNASIRQICITGICIALCYVFPLAFHAVGLGKALLPMHVPVLLCGMLCGGVYGMICGIAGPVLSSALTGMPSPAALVSMAPELAVYGLASGIAYRLVQTKHPIADLYISLIGAMVLGRIVKALIHALFYLGSASGPSLLSWVGSDLAGTVPGIICHLVIIPALIVALERTGIVPRRLHTKT